MAIFLRIENSNGLVDSVEVKKGKSVSFGRSSKAGYQIDDDLTSGIHLQISLEKNKNIVFKDLGSTNGTYFNDQRCSKGFLRLGDVIAIGNTIIELSKKGLSREQLELYDGPEATSIRLKSERTATNVTKEPQEEEDEDSLDELSIEIDLGGESSDNKTTEEPEPENTEDEDLTKTTMQTSTMSKPTQKQESPKVDSDEDHARKVAQSDGYVASGQTQFIQVDKSKLVGGTKKKKDTKASSKGKKKKKKKVKEEPKSLVSKIMGIFKK